MSDPLRSNRYISLVYETLYDTLIRGALNPQTQIKIHYCHKQGEQN
jgi:hypothetical protein